VLNNGLTVITNASNSPVAVVGLISNRGSRHELESGQATVSRSMTLENLAPMAGVNVSSYLHRERTGVFGTAIPSKAGAFAGNLVSAANTREVTDSARAHALAQLEGASGNIPLVTEDYVHMAAYQDTPLAASPFGTTAGITGNNAADLINWRNAANGGSNAVLVGTGDVSHDELCAAGEALAPDTGFAPLATPCQFTGCRFQDRNDMEQDMWGRVAFQVPGLNKPRENACFEVLKVLFGSYTPGMQHQQHSINPLIRSFQNTRPIRRNNEGGATRDVMNNDISKIDGTLHSYSDTALFGYYLHVPDAYNHTHDVLDRPIRGDSVNYKCFREIKRMWAGLSEHEIAAAKNRAILEHHLKMTSALNKADFIGNAALGSESTVTPDVVGNINKVTKQTIEAAVHKYIFDQEFVEAMYGASDATVDAGAARERSWNFLPNGMGQEFLSKGAY
jgi:predicted Zn-dependent peptidase